MVYAPVIVAPPTTRPLRHGLLDVAEVDNNVDGHWMYGGITSESDACVTASSEEDVCNTTAQRTVVSLYGTPITTDRPLFVYTLATCRLIGGLDGAQAQAERALTMSEGPEVERQFMSDLLGPRSTDVTPAGAPAGGLPIKVGLGILQAYAANRYGAEPIIHAPRSVAEFLGGSIVDDRLVTLLGVPIVAGSGYERPYAPGGGQIAAGAAFTWLYATGAVKVVRGTIDSQVTIEHVRNEVSVLAERAYEPLVDCFSVGIRVALPAAVG